MHFKVPEGEEAPTKHYRRADGRQMSSTEPKQKAELRVVLHDNGKYLLLLDARVTGWDVYIGSGKGLGKKKAKFRLSWHESGETRRHIFGAPSERGVTRERPQDFTGINYLGAFPW